jgi:spore photoproduct lyase
MNKAYFKRVFFEEQALDYPVGKAMYDKLKVQGYDIGLLKSHNRVTGIPGKSARESFFQGKNTLVVGVRKTLDFAPCKPSAHFQLPLVTGCQGICEYFYLNTQLGKKPYTRVYVNIDEILAQAANYIQQRQPETTVFEAAATSDPVPVEPFSGALAQAINFFAHQEYAYLKFVTKFPSIDSLLDLDHRGRTRIRYSLNTDRIIHDYEHRTAVLDERIQALSRLLEHGYPGGVIIAPVILEGNWQEEYGHMMDKLAEALSAYRDIHFEVISHRFARKAKSNILDVFPQTTLPMNEDKSRSYKFGQFGYGKLVYNKALLQEIKSFFTDAIGRHFPEAKIDYII